MCITVVPLPRVFELKSRIIFEKESYIVDKILISQDRYCNSIFTRLPMIFH